MQEDLTKHFIKNIEIKNFKCFEDFKAEGFGRVNLIGGKNNVGKTAFMEAVCGNIYSKTVPSFYTTLLYVTFSREKLEFINKVITSKDDQKLFEHIKSYESKTNINHIRYNLLEENGIKKYKFVIKDKEHVINVNEFSYEINLLMNILFLDNKGFTNKFLQKVYKAVQKKEKEEELNKFLSSFDNNIQKFKMLGDSPEFKLKSLEEYIKLSELGDGLKNYISIICSLYSCVNSYLFLDELDSGIHYSQLDKLWEIILTVSKQQNVQVFATTHSKECIESYARVAKKLEDEEITFIRLSKLRNGSINASVRDYKMLQYTIDDEHEVR